MISCAMVRIGKLLLSSGDIVDNLAFLSAASDNPEKVTAVCIEKHADARGCMVVIAVNKNSLSVVE